ncbi:thioredoxin-domain-containing protein [Macroventuria anomochaeta]|uniref:Thioredoxin-domain-containing protein n=1 Tax=Macroventuria anomochaeta TaxID=301207 RepID=A0ACB6SFG7_9PLEO|nr:thioredoxin-domain-containing protein [Macroventuria anomochaeta]KAF2632906.1 thioredoxin-domain-containing protein [Macroventuria anomochaeta]
MPTEVTQPLHFRTLLTGHTYLIADFYATWCPPCKQIAPIYNQLSTAHSAAGKFAFVKVNVDEAREIAAQYGIQAMPTFLLFKDGKQVEEVKGADPRKLKAVVEGASAGLKSSGSATPSAAPKTQEKEKTDDQAAQEKKTAPSRNDDGLSMLERLMQKKK